MDYASRFISRGAVVASDLGFDEDGWIKLIGNEEIRSLIVTWYAFSAFCFAKRYVLSCETFFDRTLHYVTDKF